MTAKPKRPDVVEIADVAAPGSSLPSSSSRPVVPHRDIVRDPMTIAPDTKATTGLPMEEASPTHRTGVRIEPLSAAGAEDTSAPTLAASPSAASPAEKPSAKQDEELSEIASEAEKVTAKDAAAQAAEKALAYEAEIDALIASRKYAVPLSPSRARKTGRTVTLLLFVLLLLAGAGYYYYAFAL